MVASQTSQLPKLYSVRQFAELTGKSQRSIRYALNRNMLQPAQFVDSRWVIAEDAEFLSTDLLDPTLLRNLPDELAYEYVSRDGEVTHGYKAKTNPDWLTSKTVYVPGYSRAVEGMTKTEIYYRTNVHFYTQAKLEEGKGVRPGVVARLSVGLDVPVEDLLRRDY